MNILLLNQDWFAEDLRAAGHKVISIGLSPHLDVVLERPLYHWHEAMQRAKEPFQPDLVILHDNSAPLALVGVEELECPMIFYSVDVHHHFELHCILTDIFDKTFIAQKDYINGFTAKGIEAPEWLPLWASREVDPSPEKTFGAVFVGTLNKKLNPQRVDFINKLKEQAPLTVLNQPYWEVFPFSEIVLNQTVKGDLNFRIFEAMRCGAALITEQSANGLNELFTPDVHLVTYEKNNVEQAAALVKELLANKPRCRELAAAGREEVMSKHLAKHRAQKILETIPNLKKRSSNVRYFSAMANMCHLSSLLANMDTTLYACALTHCMRLIDLGLQRGEVMNEELAFYAVKAALAFDRQLNTKAGTSVLSSLQECFPGVVLLCAAKIRTLLNQGSVSEAEKLARQVSDREPHETYKSAEQAVALAMEWGKD